MILIGCTKKLLLEIKEEKYCDRGMVQRIVLGNWHARIMGIGMVLWSGTLTPDFAQRSLASILTSACRPLVQRALTHVVPLALGGLLGTALYAYRNYQGQYDVALKEYISEKVQKNEYQEALRTQAEGYRADLQRYLPSLSSAARDAMGTIRSDPHMGNQYNSLIQSLRRQFHMYNCLKYSTFGAATAYCVVQLFSNLRA